MSQSEPGGTESGASPEADPGQLRSRDEEPVGWGDERDEPTEDADVARLLADRPPHHDRD